MADIHWGQIAITASASLLGGGLMGAFINNYLAWTRSRVQPVNYRIGTDTKAGVIGANDEYVVKISVKHGDQTYEYPRLATVNIEIANSGKNDYPEFPFGFELKNGDRAVLCEVASPDHHNPIEIVNPPTPFHPLTTVDFICKPFNRGKLYAITFYVVPGNGASACSEIKPSSPVSVKFVHTKSFVILTTDEVEYITRELYHQLPYGAHFFAKAVERLQSKL